MEVECILLALSPNNSNSACVCVCLSQSHESAFAHMVEDDLLAGAPHTEQRKPVHLTLGDEHILSGK